VICRAKTFKNAEKCQSYQAVHLFMFNDEQVHWVDQHVNTE